MTTSCHSGRQTGSQGTPYSYRQTRYARSKLPTSGPDNNNVSGSFYNLLNQYGLTESVTGSADGVNYNITQAPLYFVRSGHIGIDTIYYGIRYAAAAGYYSSSANRSLTTHYFLDFGEQNVYPARSIANRYFGFSLRCLSTVLGV